MVGNCEGLNNCEALGDENLIILQNNCENAIKWDAQVTVQLNLNFTHLCQYMCVSAHLMCVKLKKIACTCTVAHNFGMCTIASEHTQHTSDACHKLTLGLPHYTCGVQVQ